MAEQVLSLKKKIINFACLTYQGWKVTGDWWRLMRPAQVTSPPIDLTSIFLFFRGKPEHIEK